jgi:serine protease DegQ
VQPLPVSRPSFALLLGIALVAGCGPAGGSASGGVAAATGSPGQNGQNGQLGQAPGTAGGTTTTGSFEQIPSIVAEVDPSVVTVLRTDAQGSGVVWSSDGTIVTNNHVVEGVKTVVIVFADGTRADGQVLATDPLSDLAVVRTNRQGLPAATFDSALPPVGSLAIAIGNPLGFENSVTAGIISGTGRSIPGAAQQAPALVDLVQTDAAISPGNSGGALVGGDAHLIGINVAYIPPSGGAVSIGFAIPAPTVTDVVKQLIAKGRADHAYLGVQTVPLTPQIVKQFGLKAQSGALVVDLVSNGPAAAAGIKPGDVIIAIDGAAVNTAEDLLAALRHHAPGDKVTIRIVRGSNQQDVSATLGTFPG